MLLAWLRPFTLPGNFSSAIFCAASASDATTHLRARATLSRQNVLSRDLHKAPTPHAASMTRLWNAQRDLLLCNALILPLQCR